MRPTKLNKKDNGTIIKIVISAKTITFKTPVMRLRLFDVFSFIII